MMKNCSCSDWGLFIIRLAVGVIFVAHGYQKFVMIDQTISFFQMIGLSSIFAYVVAGVEVLGGLAMILGYWTHFAGIILSVVMVFAIALVKRKMPIMASEIDIILLASSLGIALTGPGKWALGKQYCKGCLGGSCCKDGACTDCSKGVCAIHK